MPAFPPLCPTIPYHSCSSSGTKLIIISHAFCYNFTHIRLSPSEVSFFSLSPTLYSSSIFFTYIKCFLFCDYFLNPALDIDSYFHFSYLASFPRLFLNTSALYFHHLHLWSCLHQFHCEFPEDRNFLFAQSCKVIDTCHVLPTCSSI